MKKWDRYVGRRVEIVWRDENFDWPYFWVERVNDDGSAELIGASYPDGSAPHDGSKVPGVRPDEIRSIRFS